MGLWFSCAGAFLKSELLLKTKTYIKGLMNIFALIATGLILMSTAQAADSKSPDFELMLQRKTLAEKANPDRKVASEKGYTFETYCNRGETPQRKLTGSYDTCEVNNIVHYTGETIVELQKCFSVCNASVRISAKDRNDFVLNQLFSLYYARKAAGKIPQATINVQTKKIEQIAWGYVRSDSTWRDF